MYVFIVFNRYSRKLMDIFLTKDLAEDYIKKQDTPDSLYIIEKFIY